LVEHNDGTIELVHYDPFPAARFPEVRSQRLRPVGAW